MSNASSSPTASPMVLPANQQAISTEKLKEILELPEYPEGYKEDFFDAIEIDLNIDKATAEDILVNWRKLELEAFRSVIGLTEEKLNEWRRSKKTLVRKKDPIFKDLITKIREKKDELSDKYKKLFTKDNICKLIEYHDYMLIRFDDSCSCYYNWAVYFNNNEQKRKKVISWLENYNLAERKGFTEEEKKGIISQIIEGKQFKEIQEIYPKLQKQIYDQYVRNIKYWFLFPEQDLFRKKINGEELDKKLKSLRLQQSTLDTNALVDLIRFGRSNFTEQHKDYVYGSYRPIASVWKILAAQNFEKPNLCNEDAISKQRLETIKKRVESGLITKKAKKNARDYLKFIDKNLPGQGNNRLRPNKQDNVISFYKWKLNEYEKLNTNPQKSIRETKSEFRSNAVYKKVQKYFGLDVKDIQRIFKQYRAGTKNIKELNVTNKEEYAIILNERINRYQAISARDIAAEVDDLISQFQEKYNILDVLNDSRSGKEVDPVAKSESQKIIRDFWEIGFSYERIMELLGLKDDFEKDCHSTAENQADSSSDAGSSSSSSTSQTRKRKAGSSKLESSNPKKQNNGKKF